MNWSLFNWVDGVWAGWVILGALQGFRRGLSGELARVISAGVALWMAWQFYEPIAERLIVHTDLSPLTTRSMAFFGLAVAGIIAMHLLRLLLRQVLRCTFCGGLERSGGLVAGVLRAALMASALVFTLGLLPQDELRRHLVTESIVGAHLQEWIGPAWEDLRTQYPALLPHVEPHQATVEQIETSLEPSYRDSIPNETPKQSPAPIRQW